MTPFEAKRLWDFYNRRVSVGVRRRALLNQFSPDVLVTESERAWEIQNELDNPATTEDRKVELLEELIKTFRETFAP